MTENEILLLTELLFSEYPAPRCALDFEDPLQLLVASRLSAQCTDTRVNKVTAELFKRYRTAKDYAEADPAELEALIFSCGLYKTKARDIIGAGKDLVKLGTFPDTMDGLLSLPGVGRKIASLLMGELYGEKNVVIADTHCIRLSNRIGLVSSKDPTQVERALLSVLPRDTGFRFSHSLVAHGRRVCMARKPDCEDCVLKEICRKNI